MPVAVRRKSLTTLLPPLSPPKPTWEIDGFALKVNVDELTPSMVAKAVHCAPVVSKVIETVRVPSALLDQLWRLAAPAPPKNCGAPAPDARTRAHACLLPVVCHCPLAEESEKPMAVQVEAAERVA